MDARNQLMDKLREKGWVDRDGALYAPRGSMWLDGSISWNLSWSDFRERMSSRRERLVAAREIDEKAFSESIADVSLLLEALDELMGVPPTQDQK